MKYAQGKSCHSAATGPASGLIDTLSENGHRTRGETLKGPFVIARGAS